MADMELVNYIRTARELGVTDPEIVSNLKEAGWEERRVNKMFSLMDLDF